MRRTRLKLTKQQCEQLVQDLSWLPDEAIFCQPSLNSREMNCIVLSKPSAEKVRRIARKEDK